MYNKRVLSTAVSELGKAKKPSKKRDNVITAKRQQTPIVTTQGFKQGPPPLGSKYRIPGDTLYNPTPYPIEAVSDNGIRKTLNPFDTSNIKFPGANYVDEYEKKEEGGEYYDDELTQEEIDDLIAQGYVVEDLPKAQLGKGTTVEVSPFSLNANQSQLASNVYGEYDPEFLIGARTPLGGSRDPRFSTDLGLTLGVPYSGSMIPSVNADWRWRYRPSAVSAGAFAPTVQTDITLGWDPTQGFNHKMVASPRWEFGNRMLGVYRQPRWPVGAWKGYAGPAAGWEFRQHSFVPGLEGYQNTGEHRTGNFNFDYGAVAGIEARPFKSTPLRVGADASLMFQPGKGQAEEQFNPDTDFNTVKWGMTPMLKVKAVYPIGANLPKKKEAEEEKIKIDAARANDKNFMVTAPTITGPGVDWGYEEKPESTGVPVGYLPGYEPETGRKLTEQELMQRYGQGPRLAKGGSLLTKKVTCKDCGWKWNAADGGNDVTTCHKCGGQGLLHVQKGGLPKAQFGMFDKWKKKNVDQAIADAEPQEGVQQLMEVEASGDEAKKKLHISLMDKARALGRTVAGRKVWMEDGPRNWTFDEIQGYVNKVNDYNQQAQKYERDRRLLQDGKLSTDVFAQRYRDNNWARFDQATKKESFKGQYQNAVDEGMARKEKNFAVTQGLAELTGVPAAMRIVSDPVGTLKGVGTSLADLAMLPYAAWQARDWADNTLNMKGTWNLSENPITGQDFGEGFNESMDVASVLPFFGAAAKMLRPATATTKTVGTTSKVVGNTVGEGNVIMSNPKLARIAKDLPDNLVERRIFEYTGDGNPRKISITSEAELEKILKVDRYRIQKLKKQYPDLDFNDPSIKGYYFTDKESINRIPDILKGAQQNQKSAESFGTYLMNDYDTKMAFIQKSGNQPLINVVNESPQYLDEVYAHLSSPNTVSDADFLNDLVVKSNSYTRFMERQVSNEAASELVGRNIENPGWSMDVEGVSPSDYYGAYGYKIRPNMDRIYEIVNAPVEQKWGLRQPTFEGGMKMVPSMHTGLPEKVEDFLRMRTQRLNRSVTSNVGEIDPYEKISRWDLYAPMESRANVQLREFLPKEFVESKYYTIPKHQVFNVQGDYGQKLQNFDVFGLGKLEFPKNYTGHRSNQDYGRFFEGTGKGFARGGITMGQEVDLSPEQEAHLRKLGYKLERI